jgi:hypothetical protein
MSFQPPGECPKCGGAMVKGFTVDNAKVINDPHPAYGPRMKLGGSHSWWQLFDAQTGETVVSPLPGMNFNAARVLRGTQGIQVFTYRCQDCGLLEAYAPSA